MNEIAERHWIAPDGVEFYVEDTHADWINSHRDILDKYKVKDRTREGLMAEGWIRLRKDRWVKSLKNFQYIEVQFNFKYIKAWVLADKYVMKNLKLEVLIANFNERLFGPAELLFAQKLYRKKLIHRETLGQLKTFLKRYKSAIEQSTITDA
jgi:hypothetical protein